MTRPSKLTCTSSLPSRFMSTPVRRETREDSTGLVAPTSPVESSLVSRRTGVDMNLEGSELVHVSFDGRVIYRNPWLGTRLSEDDIAVASMLEAEGAWVRGEGPEPYPLAQACQDHAIGLAIQESARTGAEVHVAKNVWALSLIHI